MDHPYSCPGACITPTASRRHPPTHLPAAVALHAALPCLHRVLCVPHTHTHAPNLLTQWFDAIDKDGNGQLTPMELQAALQLGRLNFSLATVAHIIRIHDKTGSGTISFDEFGKLHEFLTNVQQRWVWPLPSLCACTPNATTLLWLVPAQVHRSRGLGWLTVLGSECWGAHA